VLKDGHGTQVWSSNTAGRGSQPFKLRVVDCNLLLSDRSDNNIWVAAASCDATGGTMLRRWGAHGARVPGEARTNVESASDS
jgi:hypothetical protein